MGLAVAVTLAMPAPLVTADEADKAAEAPEAGAEKLTVIPLNGSPEESVTLAWSAVAKTVLIAVDCGVPATAVTVAGGPELLVRLKVAGVETPETAAVTL